MLAGNGRHFGRPSRSFRTGAIIKNLQEGASSCPVNTTGTWRRPQARLLQAVAQTPSSSFARASQ
eukprot:750963-Rhodomonas_salina.1